MTDKIIFTVIVFVIGIAIGYYALPDKVVTKVEVQTITETVYKERTDLKKDQITVIEEIKKPDGTVITKTTITDKSSAVVSKDSEGTEKTNLNTETVTVHSKNSLMISALAGVSVTDTAKVIFGAHVQGRIVGPVYVGGFGLQNGVIGVSLGLTF